MTTEFPRITCQAISASPRSSWRASPPCQSAPCPHLASPRWPRPERCSGTPRNTVSQHVRQKEKRTQIKAHIVSAQDADDLTAAVQLHEQPLVDVLLQFGLRGGHRVMQRARYSLPSVME